MTNKILPANSIRDKKKFVEIINQEQNTNKNNNIKNISIPMNNNINNIIKQNNIIKIN